MSWSVEVLPSAVPELEALSADLRARFVRIVSLIEQQGLESVHQPHIKHLDGDLWEMRMKGRDGIARAIYVTAFSQRVVVVHVFVKKTQKTPRRAIEIARLRAKEVQL